MLKLKVFVLLLLYIRLVDSIYFDFIGLAVDCISSIINACTVIYLPSGYFAIKNICLNDILKESRGLIILFQNKTFEIEFINRGTYTSYLYPIKTNTTFIKAVDYFYNGSFIMFNKDNITYSNNTKIGFINEIYVSLEMLNNKNYNTIDQKINQLFVYYYINNTFIFNEINIFPKLNETIYIDYKDGSQCKKNNIIIYDESIYDDSCRINYD